MLTSVPMPTGWAYCHVHNACEYASERDYIECFECGHVYRSRSELRTEYARQWKPIHLVPKADDIFYCPLCAHDF